MSISQRKDGRFLVKYKDPAGTWKQKSFRARADAEAFEAENVDEQQADNSRLTIIESILLFLGGTKHCATRRWKYSKLIFRMGDEFGQLFVDGLTRRDLETFRAILRGQGVCVNVINE